MKFNMIKEIWILVILTILAEGALPALVGQSDLSKCSYGDRGSLTSTCVNAYPGYFRSTTYRFDQLDETVMCLNCTLTTIETGNFDISGNQIKNLWLNNSKIEKINPKGFVGLIFLERLMLGYNQIKSIVPTTFSGVKKIKYIDLSHNQIEMLSNDGFIELLDLEVLDFESNSIQSIAAKAFNGLKHIKIINLKDNKITDVNGTFGDLSSLNILNLQQNRISSLRGEEFLNLTGLLELNLANNNLKSPVLELDPKNGLKNLYMQNNLIEVLEAKFLKGLHSLENLDLSHNLISDISIKTWEKLFQLRQLNVSYNQIGVLETGTFSGLPQLELLNCSHNNITEIRITGVFSLHSLHSLDISYNQLTDFEYIALISRLPTLSYLNLEDNRLPCYLEDEMSRYFEEDNFKYVLYNDKVGSFKCLDVPVKSHLKIADQMVSTAEPAPSGVSAAEATIIVLMCIVFVCIGLLFYMQYRTYHDMNSNRPNRAMSSARLVSSEVIDNGDDNYLQE